MKRAIWANTLVYNEENFLWFAVMSVIKYVDKILIWDSGSTDKTLKIIEELRRQLGSKITFKEVGRVTNEEYTKVRQEMLDQTKADWFIVLDGDEVWWEDSISQVKNLIETHGDKLDSIVVPFYNCLGDIYHYQEEKAGRYKIDNKVGHISVKAINRKIKGLHLENPYGQEGYFDEKNTPIQLRDKKRRYFLKAPFMHLTHLPRTSKTNPKFKYELGYAFPKDFKYPEVFYQDRPNFVQSPFKKRDNRFLIKSTIFELPRKLKRSSNG